jgi:GT2 family glycosyltransferase
MVNSLSNISVVISVYSINRAKDLADCIESIKKQTLLPEEIIVVLDPDDSLVAYYRKRLHSPVKLVVSDVFGLSAARNMGIRSSNSEFVAFIDDDAVADPDWLKNLVNNFGDSSVIGVGGRIIPVWPSENPNWFPEELYWIVGCSYKGLPTKKASIRNPIGCNMAFRRIIFEKVGYFSVETGRVGNKLMGHDDTEFGIRASKEIRETKILYDPYATVYHRVSKNRVSVKYLMKRSYVEGFSKAFISENRSSLNVEKTYLQNLFSKIPNIIFKDSIPQGILRLFLLWMSTAFVFFGYIAGSKAKHNEIFNL